MDEVILVDANDQAIGTMEKMAAHREGHLHRAFSVLIFNQRGELMLQKRASTKYHSAGLWTNTCCSHPAPGEATEQAVHRRLREEMGFDTELRFSYKFIYKASFENNLIEHELDHVFIGIFNHAPAANSAEVEAWKFASPDWIRQDIIDHPENYTVWFRMIMNDPRFRSLE